MQFNIEDWDICSSSGGGSSAAEKNENSFVVLTASTSLGIEEAHGI